MSIEWIVNFVDQWLSKEEKEGRHYSHIRDYSKLAKLEIDELKSFRESKENAQHRLHLTAFGVGMLAFFAGFGVCWLVFVR